MKKILSILLALAMILSLSIPAFAENETNTDGGSDPSQTVTTTGENSQNVTADYTPTPASDVDEAKWGASKEALTNGSSGTLAEAFTAAAGDPNIKYIQLQKSITPESPYTINGGSFTLDLNGCSITYANAVVIYVDNADPVITFADSKETGKISGYTAVSVSAGSVSFTSGNYEGTMGASLSVYSGASATINKGNFNVTHQTGCNVENLGTLTIKDGTFTGGTYEVYNCGTMTIEGGSFSGARNSTIDLNSGSATIKGGTFASGEIGVHFDYSGGTFDLSGYDTTKLTDLKINNYAENVTVDGNITLPDGYGLSEDGTKTVETLKLSQYAIISTNGGSTTPDPDPTNPEPSIPTTDPEAKWGASINDLNIGSGTLGEAFIAAADDPDIKYIQIQKSPTPGICYAIDGGSFTLDLNNCTVTNANAAVFIVRNSGTVVTFTDSNTNSQSKVTGYNAIYIDEGKAIIEKGNYEGSAHALNLEGGSAEVRGGNFSETANGDGTVTTNSTSNLIISGGTFTANGAYYTVDNKGTMTISGGSFSGAENASVRVLGNTTITGGNFGESQCGHIEYGNGTLDLSGYGITNASNTTFTELTICNEADADVVVSDSTIKLPAGYGLYDRDENNNQTFVTTLVYGNVYAIKSTKATITGVSIKVMNGTTEVQPENSIYTITPDCSVTITVTGENLNNATSDYVVVVGKAYALTSEFGWTLSDGNKTATKTLSADAFTTCTSASEVKYTTNATAGDSVTYTQTDYRVIYQSPTSVEITWGAMSFYYDDEKGEDGNDKGWMPTADGANTITVENKGTTEITPSVTYTPNDSFKDVIAGTITADSNANCLENGQKKVYTLTLSGKPTAAFESTTIGTITVTIVENAGE